jgi:hypothetical protein
MKKAYGFPLVDYGNNNVHGQCFSEDGQYLGSWTSSDLTWLKQDLANHADGYDYQFVMVIPSSLIEAFYKHNNIGSV